MQAGVLTVVLALILVYTRRQERLCGWRLERVPAVFAVGCALGALAVFLGIGGGPINVCALTLCFSLGMKECAVYSLAIIFFSQLAKLASSVVSGALVAMDASYVPVVVLSAVAGGLVGTRLNRNLSEQGVRHVYVAVLGMLPIVSLYNCTVNLCAL